MPVAHDQDWDVFAGETGFFGLGSALSGRPRHQPLRALDRAQEERLVGLDDAFDLARFGLATRSQEAVAPAERGGQINAAAGRRLAQADAVDQRPGVVDPNLAAVQLGQRHSRQGVERAPAFLALVALQAADTARGTNPLRVAMATGRRCREPVLDHGDDVIGRSLELQRRHQRIALDRQQLAQLLDKRLEFLGFHLILRFRIRCASECQHIKAKQSLSS